MTDVKLSQLYVCAVCAGFNLEVHNRTTDESLLDPWSRLGKLMTNRRFYHFVLEQLATHSVATRCGSHVVHPKNFWSDVQLPVATPTGLRPQDLLKNNNRDGYTWLHLVTCVYLYSKIAIFLSHVHSCRSFGRSLRSSPNLVGLSPLIFRYTTDYRTLSEL
jgi:hypothetical protein